MDNFFETQSVKFISLFFHPCCKDFLLNGFSHYTSIWTVLWLLLCTHHSVCFWPLSFWSGHWKSLQVFIQKNERMWCIPAAWRGSSSAWGWCWASCTWGGHGGFTEHLLLIEVEKLNCHIHMLQVLITSGGTTGLHVSPVTAGNPISDQSLFQEPLCRWTLK